MTELFEANAMYFVIAQPTVPHSVAITLHPAAMSASTTPADKVILSGWLLDCAWTNILNMDTHPDALNFYSEPWCLQKWDNSFNKYHAERKKLQNDYSISQAFQI